MKPTISIAMEGYNGWARPFDSQILKKGYKLYNVNNVKLARFKEIFPASAKTDAIDARKIVELFSLGKHLTVAKKVLQEIKISDDVNAKLKKLTRRRDCARTNLTRPESHQNQTGKMV